MLDATFHALSDPTRRAIVEFLREEDLSVGQVVEKFELTQSAISRHLDVLERARLIKRRRVGQRRMCSMTAAPLQELSDWLDAYRSFWCESLERLDDVIAESKA